MFIIDVYTDTTIDTKERYMEQDAQVILDLSEEVQALLDRQRVDLFRELQREIPSLRLSRQADPTAAAGSRGLVTIITVTTGLVATLSPIILRILAMITPPNRVESMVIEEGETLHPDGTRTTYRKRVLTQKEQRLSDPTSAPPTTPKLSSSSHTDQSELT
jgi:hypothetical protein